MWTLNAFWHFKLVPIFGGADQASLCQKSCFWHERLLSLKASLKLVNSCEEFWFREEFFKKTPSKFFTRVVAKAAVLCLSVQLLLLFKSITTGLREWLWAGAGSLNVRGEELQAMQFRNCYIYISHENLSYKNGAIPLLRSAASAAWPDPWTL